MANDSKPPEEVERDEFADAFKDLTSGLKTPGSSEATPAATETPEAKAAREAAAAAATETPEAKAAREAAAAAATETPEAKAAREAAAAAATETPEAKAAREAAAAAATETPEAKAAREAAAATAKPNVEEQLADATRRLAELEAARTPPATPPAAAEPQIYTPQEQEVLSKYLAEWEMVRQGEELIRRGEYRQLVQFIYGQMDAKYGHLLQYVEDRAPRDHYSAIVQLVPDYDAVRDKAVAWATSAEQPKIMRDAFQRVVNDGEPEEVADLIAAWKKASNYQPPAASTPPSTATATPVAGAPPTQAANDPARATAVAALKPVAGERTVPTEGPDKNDFEGAFKEFAAVAR